jgi:hypothetical protein
VKLASFSTAAVIIAGPVYEIPILAMMAVLPIVIAEIIVSMASSSVLISGKRPMIINAISNPYMARASPKMIAITNLLPNSGFSEVTEASAGAQVFILNRAAPEHKIILRAAAIMANIVGSII